MSDGSRVRAARRRVTLDGQLVTYWEREALRLEALAAASRWGWLARGHRRKADRARQQAARFEAREHARTPDASPPEAEPS
ncbi:hypothetical protein MKK58_21710 [Methylobacterium sp. J-078]|uniref:hypothetical protein n=1 Tax=Methylobacterium sp. J-078 TaxID=2836657 RepID=UPI001FB8B016|nr:hypothetical protein [Methylobacterium sp. J-078]MCJ2047133.1 hypothetical protein [Methylobacterium sp. J-078]